MRILASILLVLFCCGCRLPVDMSTPGGDLLTVERIFGSDEFSGEQFSGARWMADGSGYTRLETSVGAGKGRDIVRHDPVSGATTTLVPAARLVPEGASDPLSVDDYQWSMDGRRLLIFTNTKRVWRRNTRGDYWVLDLESRRLTKLGGDAQPSTLMFAKFSPDGRRVAYVRENNIYVETVEGGAILALTADGSDLIVNGTSDWVNEEEFDLRDGFRWSPDGTKIAYWQFDTEGIETFYLINNTAGLYARLTPIRYPKVGTTNSACRVGVVSATGGETLWMRVPGDPRNHYIPRMEWAASSAEVVIQRMNRLQNTNEVMLCDASTGEARTVFVDRDAAWVDVCDDMRWLDRGARFTFVSERDGWRHVYVVSRDSSSVKPVTSGDFDVISIECIDEVGGFVYFIASPDDPIRRYLFRAPLSGQGTAERLSPADRPGTHAYQVSPDGRFAFHTYSRFGVPPTTDLVSLPEHRRIRLLVDNEKLRKTVESVARAPAEFFRVAIDDGVELDGWILRPPNLDPSRRYPLFFYVYGEPAGSTVRDVWGGDTYLWHLMLAQRGYLVVSIDNRGTRTPRGRDWRKSIYRQIGILASADQAAATRALIDRWPYVDPERIGIWGWSGGGSMSLNAIFRYPDLYHTAMSVAPVSDQRFYDTIYQERYMGLPDDNRRGFEQGSPITYAHQLEGNLLIVHGTADDNVHYQSCEALVDRLIEHNRPFTMMAYPNRSHGIHEGEGTTLHLYSLLERYLIEHLPPGPD